MSPLIWLATKAFLACVLLTPVIRDIFRSYQVVDRPDKKRKIHIYPIPRVGGIPIALAYAFALYPFLSYASGAGNDYSTLTWKLIPAALVMFATGLIDDFLGLRAWQKLTGQLVAASLAYWAGVRVLGIAGYSLVEWVNLPLTIVWLILCANAFNLVDGLDGLAAGMGLVGALTMTIAALMNGLTALAFVTVPLAGALIGFLCFNFNPATIFLGDSGALLIGFLLGCFGAIWTQKSAALIGITVPILAVAIPMLDVGLAIIRRFLGNQPIFSADRAHIHHRLLDRGLTPRSAVLILYLVCATAASFGLLLTLPYGRRFAGFAVLVLCALGVWGVRELRYAEFGMIGRIMFGGELQRLLHSQLRMGRIAADLENAATDREYWNVVHAAARDLGFTSVHACLDGNAWEEVFRHLPPQDCWSVRAPLGVDDWVQLTRPFDSGVQPMLVAAFLEALRRTAMLRAESGLAARAAEKAI